MGEVGVGVGVEVEVGVEAVPEKVAWVLVRDGRVLVTRNRGVDVFYFPGGKREPGESDAQTLEREIAEELESRIDTATMAHFGTFETRRESDGRTEFRMICYTAEYSGPLLASMEIAESAWFGYGDRARVSPVDRMVFDALHAAGRLAGADTGAEAGRRDAIDAARAVVEEHHADARAAFLGGSVVTERRTEMSDLDIVVLVHGAPAPYRASFRRHGWPVELLVHTEESWWAFVEQEVRRRRSPLLWMCAAGVLLFDADGVGARLSGESRRLAAAGPPPVDGEEIDDDRYAITDLLDDLAGCTDQGERLFICTELARRTAELALSVGGSWIGTGKWLARRLDTAAPGLGTRLHHGVHQALEGRTESLVGVVDEVLAQAGGRLWAGYRRGGTPRSHDADPA